MSDFTGRCVLITGGATGIGRGAAEALLTRGASVVVAGHDDAQVAQAESELRRSHERVCGVVADVRRLADLERAAAKAASIGGGLHHLVCAAGIQIPGTAVTASERDWESVIDVNLSGAFRACKSALPHLHRAGGGSIVIVSSIQALRGKRNGVAYVAAKGGLNAMTRALALDHASDGIRVNAVCPGVVDTPMLRQAAARAGDGADIDATVRNWAMAQPLGTSLGRACTPADVASLIAFLLSDEARYITGTEFTVDGGLAAKLAM